MNNGVTATLARFASQLAWDDLPERVRSRVKDLLLDALACALAGYRGEDTGKVMRFASALGASQESSVIGGGRLSLAGATLFNGFLVTAVSMCDVYRPTATHFQPVIVSPALAIAERDAMPGRDLLVALAAGFETAARIAAGLDYGAFRARGWHGPGTLGPFGAAAAVGRLRAFDAAAMATAFALAGSQAAGTFAAWGTPSVKFHQFRGALSGLMAALLAEQGYAATHEFLTAPDGGFYSTYSGTGPSAAATARLGEHWELERIALRPTPTSAASQGIVTALFELMRRDRLEAARTRKLRIRVSPACFDAYVNRRDYQGKWEASASLHYTAAALLFDRELWLDQFESHRTDNPALRRFARECVELAGDPGLAAEQAIVEAELEDGSRLHAACMASKGTPENPLTRAEIEAKLRRAAADRLPQSAAERIIERVANLEQLSNARALLDALRR